MMRIHQALVKFPLVETWEKLLLGGAWLVLSIGVRKNRSNMFCIERRGKNVDFSDRIRETGAGKASSPTVHHLPHR